MKQMIVTNKETGQKVQFAWDKAGNPTKEDLDRIFAEKEQSSQEQPMTAQNKPVQPFNLREVLDQAQVAANGGKVEPVRSTQDPQSQTSSVQSSRPVQPVRPVNSSRPAQSQVKDSPLQQDHSLTIQSLQQQIQKLLYGDQQKSVGPVQ